MVNWLKSEDKTRFNSLKTNHMKNIDELDYRAQLKPVKDHRVCEALLHLG